MRSFVSPCVFTVCLLLLGVLIYSVSPANGYNQNQGSSYEAYPRVVETGNPDRVFTELSYKLWILWVNSNLASFTQSCGLFQSNVLSESFRSNRLSPYCTFLSDACGRAETALYNSDCFVKTMAVALTVTCCQDIRVTTQRTTPTTRTTTRTTPTTQTTTRTTPTTTRTTPTTTTTTSPPPIQSCGIASAAIPKIVGGSNTTECEFTWVVGIWRNGILVCGGAIVSNYHIITAAHCASAEAEYAVEISKWRTNSTEDRFTQLIKVTNKFIYPSYDAIRLINDIAVLKLERPVSFGLCVQPICLLESFEKPQTEKCTAAGWGTLRLWGGRPIVLQKVDLTVYLSDVCMAKFNVGSSTVTPAVMCADNDGLGGKDACQGDSGGPLMCVVNGKYSLMGLVSSGRGCADAGQAGFYTFVPYFKNWLNIQLLQ